MQSAIGTSRRNWTWLPTLGIGLILALTTDSAAHETSWIAHHDGTLEVAWAWGFLGVEEPYFGAFGEAFDLSNGTVLRAEFLLTQIQAGGYSGATTDVYIWRGGVDDDPADVLFLATGLTPSELPLWPMVGSNVVEIGIEVDGPVTVGSWGNWPGAREQFYWAMDTNGNPGAPWTNVSFNAGWDPGWQRVPDVGPFGDVKSLGIAVEFTPNDPVAVRASSWGAVKALLRGSR